MDPIESTEGAYQTGQMEDDQIMSDQDSNDEAEEEASETTILNTTHRQAPESTWVPGQQAKYECATCTLCSTGSDCPTAGHPFNTELQTGLRCYQLSQKQLEELDTPKPYKKPPKRFYTDDFTWYVVIPLEEECDSLIFRYRVALAEMENAKATIYTEKPDDEDCGKGFVFEIGMKQSTDIKMVLEEAREILRDRLRSNVNVWAMEVSIDEWQ
ncbi:uncharacterized protein APUU_11347A [Aspergillus puulaauensis]|uniref:Uncharacterized protein n=1 Tax=Aspergillus puulaauensis TaxID=1220207 RepID=A0A7R8AGE2_9EURO|nr:uncharacterized protein APUU_11347A [Aspergillus puulaauensis]BCS18519.1 hypothetical protein APUU_11347A [Aspergillus puulaauensis]